MNELDIDKQDEEAFCQEEDRKDSFYFEECLDYYNIEEYDSYDEAVEGFKKVLTFLLKENPFVYFENYYVYESALEDFFEDMKDVLKVLHRHSSLSESLPEKDCKEKRVKI